MMKTTYIAARVTNVAPIGSTEDHEETVDSHTRCIVVLIEDALELHYSIRSQLSEHQGSSFMQIGEIKDHV